MPCCAKRTEPGLQSGSSPVKTSKFHSFSRSLLVPRGDRHKPRYTAAMPSRLSEIGAASLRGRCMMRSHCNQQLSAAVGIGAISSAARRHSSAAVMAYPFRSSRCAAQQYAIPITGPEISAIRYRQSIVRRATLVLCFAAIVMALTRVRQFLSGAHLSTPQVLWRYHY